MFWKFVLILVIQLLGFLFSYLLRADGVKVALVLVMASAISQMVLDFVPSSVKSKPILSALARIAPIVVALGVLLT